MDERERQRRILNFIYAQPDIPTSVRHAFRQWMADQERNPEVDRLMEELWETNDAEASPEKIRKGLDRLHAKIRRSRLRHVLRYAGAAAAAVLMFAGGYFSATRSEKPVERITLVTAKGHMGEFTLPDGSRVWLNEESRLAYDADFSGKAREVTLSGEAFFEVEKDSLRPFRVEMGGLEIEVLGTSFDAIGYAADPARQVILKSGSVSISGEGLSRPVRLCPDQKFTQSVLQGEFSIEQVDARNYCQWFEERLVFYNMPLTDIIVNLERKYHVEIVLSPSLPANKRLSLVVQHEPLEDIMEVISRLMPVRCQIDGDRVFVTNRGKSR